MLGLKKAGRAIGVVMLFGCASSALHPAEQRTLETSGTTVAYVTYGGAPPVLLMLHGWASDSSIWDLLAPRLVDVGSPIAVDAPGHGRSPRESSSFNIRRYAALARDVAVAEHENEVVLVAHSNGAYAAREYYRANKGAVCAIVILDGTFRQQFGDPAAFRAFVESMKEDEWPAALAAMDTPRGASKETLKRLPEMHRGISLEIAQEASLALLDATLYADDTVDAPLLLIVGSSTVWDDAHINWMRGIAPALRVERLEGVSHWLAWDAADRVAVLIAEFLSTTSCTN